MHEENQFVASKEGMKLLGVNSGRFFYYVKKGHISKEPGNKKRNARYKVDDILRLKEKLTNKQHKTKKVELPYGYVGWIESINDVLTSLKLDYLVYGEEVAQQLGDLHYYTERVKRNPRVALAVYDSPRRENIRAYISLLPVPEPIILDVLAGKKVETDIKTEDIETYEREGAYTLLAESVVVHPEYPGQMNTLLSYLLNYWCEQYPLRYISRIYAQAASRKGDVLIQKLYFAPLYGVGKNAFVLDLERPGASRFVRHFQECLAVKGWKAPEDYG